MKTNKLLSLILCAVAIFSIPIIVFAHPGKTDEYGGHYDWKTGEYHYHYGYPAHQHIDGYCPYDYDDQTDHSNHGGGYNYDYDYDYDYNYDYDYEEPADNYNYEEEIKDKPVRYTVIGHILNFVCSLFTGVLVGFYFRILVTCFRSVILNNFKINTDYANDTLIYCEPIIDTFFVFSLVMQYFYNFDIDTTKRFAIYRNIWLVLQLIIIMQTMISQKKTQKEEIKRKSQIQKAPQTTVNDLVRIILREKLEEQAQKREQEYTNIIEQERKNPTITAEEVEQSPEKLEETVEKEEQPPEEVAQEEPKPTIEPTRKIYHYHTQSYIMPVDPKHVYWTANGKSFHSNRMCLALRNCTTVSSGTLTKAQRLGHKTPCSVCVGKNYKVKKK